MQLVAKRMKSILIAHRGLPDSYPENSITGFKAALQSGAAYIETDIQLTSDHIPVLSHDPTLLKLTGREMVVTETDYEDFRDLPAGYPTRFEDRFNDFRIPTLDELVELITDWPDIKIFVEIKRASLEKYGSGIMIDVLRKSLARIKSQCIIISFDYPVLQIAMELGNFPIGWILPEWTEQNHKLAELLAPEYLFCNRKRLPEGEYILWKGAWQWVVYTVNNPGDVHTYLAQGFNLVETNCIDELTGDKSLSP